MIRLSGNTASLLIASVSPEHLEHPEHVRPELDAGADLLEFGGLLDSCTSRPLRASASAAASPPMPPPTISTGLCCCFGVLTCMSNSRHNAWKFRRTKPAFKSELNLKRK